VVCTGWTLCSDFSCAIVVPPFFSGFVLVCDLWYGLDQIGGLGLWIRVLAVVGKRVVVVALAFGVVCSAAVIRLVLRWVLVQVRVATLSVAFSLSVMPRASRWLYRLFGGVVPSLAGVSLLLALGCDSGCSFRS